MENVLPLPQCILQGSCNLEWGVTASHAPPTPSSCRDKSFAFLFLGAGILAVCLDTGLGNGGHCCFCMAGEGGAALGAGGNAVGAEVPAAPQ